MSFSKLPPFWINPVYRDGTLIDAQLMDAAQDMWSEAAFSTDRWLRDVNRTAEIMEMAVHAVWSKFLQGSIEDLSRINSYLQRTFYHLLARIALREGWLVYNDPKILIIDRESPEPTPEAKKVPAGSLSKSKPRKKAMRWLWSRRDSFGNARLIETSVQLDLMLERLSVRERTLLILFWIHGDDWENISQQTGIPIGTAKVIASRALRKLQRIAKGTFKPRNNVRSKNDVTE